MQTVWARAWAAAWVGLPLECHLTLKAPAGREGMRAAKSWMAKQGFSRLRNVVTRGPAVVDMLSGCTALRSMEVEDTR